MTRPAPPQIHEELRPHLDTIADRLLSGHAVVMIGAGFSKNAASPGSRPRFPDWSQLGDRLHTRLHGRPPGPAARYLQVPALAHQVEAAFGRPALDQMLRDAVPDLQHEPSPLHVDLLDLPWSDVFTTNYDTLLERARRSVISQRYDLVLKPDDLTHSNRPRIVKLHGSVPSERPFIITDEDYRRYPRDFAPFVNAVRQAILENTLCLIGFSGDDPNFLQWVGWIHDSLGRRNAPKMYLIGLLDLSQSQKTFLSERRNITPVDMSLCPGIGDDHYQALQHFLAYLHSRRTADSQLYWPSAETPHLPSENRNAPNEIRKTVEVWKGQRRRYPGWVVLPDDLRSSLRFETSPWLHELPAANTLPPALDLEFAFELTWRMEKWLCPIFDNQVPFIEATIDRYWRATESGPSLESLPLDRDDPDSPELALDPIRSKCHHVLLAMMRHYREEGLSAKWDEADNRIQAVLPALSPEHEAQFYYERALFALFALDLHQLKTRLAEWPRNDALPFWTAKKAGLLAELGRMSEATQLLEQSLDTIRAKLNLTPPQTDYTLVSQESFVMYLLDAVRQPSVPGRPDPSYARRQRREFRERWHVLKRYKCDPWQEFATFEHKLQRPSTALSDMAERPAFDIGVSVHTQHWRGWNHEALAACSFLRFCEDAGIPFRIPGCTIATESAAGTLTRIAHESSHWALATLVRIGDTKAVEEIFDRATLARMSTASVDGLITRYLEALRLAVADIATGDRWRAANFGTLLAGVIPEILSRLCCKCSQDAREKLLDWLLEVYGSDRRSNYRGIRHLISRLLEASPGRERAAIVPKLLDLPILTVVNQLEELEYANPFDFLDLHEESLANQPAIPDAVLSVFLREAASDNPVTRRRAVTTLGRLHGGGLLDEAASRRFSEGLWSRVDDYGLPSSTNYYRYAFLSLPHPANIDPVEHFVRYVRDARFPAQESEKSTRYDLGGRTQEVALCRNIRAASEVRWSTDDLLSIVQRLVQWWDTDKAHWGRVPDKSSFPSNVLGNRLSDLVRTLAAIVVRYPDSVADETVRSAVTRVAAECPAHEVPALRLELACAYAFAVPPDEVLRRVEEAMTAPRTDAVMDALEAMDIVSRNRASESDRDHLMQLLRAAAQMIRWRCVTALWATLDAVGDVVDEHPWTFVGDIASWVLTGLGRLGVETTVGGKHGAGNGASGGLQDVSQRLVVRRAAARLAYRLFTHYQAQGKAIPETIGMWESVCRSEDEFLDVKNEWLAS